MLSRAISRRRAVAGFGSVRGKDASDQMVRYVGSPPEGRRIRAGAAFGVQLFDDRAGGVTVCPGFNGPMTVRAAT
jgi:hypothetical protein